MARLSGQKGGDEVGRGRKGNGSNILVMTDGNDLLLSAFITAVNTSEVHSIETLVDECHCSTSHWPKRLFYDNVADADWLRETLGGRGMELICLHGKNRTHPPPTLDACWEHELCPLNGGLSFSPRILPDYIQVGEKLKAMTIVAAATPGGGSIRRLNLMEYRDGRFVGIESTHSSFHVCHSRRFGLIL